ncbi:MAG TPA: serine/threonine-protein kinase [Pyrinomonadaceae bacterium]|jgi:hypothetical protein
MSLAPDTRLGRYEIRWQIGAGGMGEVYLASDTLLGREVALKVLPDQFASEPHQLARFVREARAASALNHPNILTVYDVGEQAGTHFIVTELIDGLTLRDWVREARPSLAGLCDAVRQAALALAAAHRAGIVHRDVKPENLMRRRDGYVKVLDFGIAKALARGDSPGASADLLAVTQPGVLLGTLRYMLPEQVNGEEVDAGQMPGMGLSLSGGQLAMAAPGLPGDIGDAVDALAGDIFRWIEHALDDVLNFVVRVSEGVAHFFVQIGEQWYHFLLRCVEDVAHGIQFVLNKIGAAFEKLVRWLGFIFNWDDILRTHRVLKNIFRRYAESCVASISTWEGELNDLFVGLEDKLNAWAKLPPVAQGTVSGASAASTPRPGQGSPQAHWGVQQTKSNMTGSSTDFVPGVPGGDELEQLLDDLWGAIQQEESNFKTAYENLYNDVVKQITTIPAGEAFERIVAILLDLLVSTVQDIIVTLLKVLQLFLQGALDALDAPLDIPVISWLYKLISGDQLSFLDLACLLVAIPSTVIYKLAEEEVPFPDDATTDALINAPDFATIRQILGGGSAAPAGLTEAAAAATSAADVVPVVFDISAYFATLGLIPLTAWKALSPNSKAASLLYFLVYLPYASPNIQIYTPQAWYVKLDEVITGVSVVKALGDVSLCNYKKGVPGQNKILGKWSGASPYCEMLINAAWEVPAVAGIVHDHSAGGVVSFLGNTAFNASGVMSPWADENDYVFAAMLICMGIYGELELVTGLTAGDAPLPSPPLPA